MGIVHKLREIGAGVARVLRGHQHQFVEFDESGDPLDVNGYREACFRGCLVCGRIELNPLGFQDDASLDNYLSIREIGGSSAELSVAAYLKERQISQETQGE